jgi:5-methylcytosine-specific restriction endonuclease McrA
VRVQVLDEQEHRCARCNIHQDDLKLREPREFLEVHHRDGDTGNHRRSNLVGYCPECHHIVEKELAAAAN